MHDSHPEVPRVRTITPYGYAKDVEPPKDWSRVVDGHRITPKVIRRTLKRCHAAGRDLKYIAARLGVGYAALLSFLKSEKAIPMECAEKFYKLFTSGEALPKAEPEGIDTDEWIDDTSPCANIQMPSPDFDAERLAPILIAEREKRGMTVKDVSIKTAIQMKLIRSAEAGLNRYRTSPNSVVFRLCEFYGLDVRDFELKPRIRFPELQQRLKRAKEECGLTWIELKEKTGADPAMCNSVLFRKTYGDIVYLSNGIRTVTAALGVDITEYFEEGCKKEVISEK